MYRKQLLKRRTTRFGLAALVAAGLLGIWGCGDHPTSYEDPVANMVTTNTPTALIEAATLMQWIDEGRLNSTDVENRDKIVVLTMADAGHYDAGHIPGSQLWNFSTEVFQTRLEGVAPASMMVLDGQNLDAMLRRFSIDRNTTVVFTVSAGLDLRQATRGYFTLRYWGFSRNRLKVLQGGDTGWVAAGHELSTAVPLLAPSNFSVRDLADTSIFCGDQRATIGDMISAVDGLNAGTLTNIAIVDVRSSGDPGRVAYMTNAGLDNWKDYYVAATTATLIPTGDFLARLSSFGVTENTTMTYFYCKGGVKATVPYFILDGILDWPVQMYDGSWGQWGAYTTGNGVSAAWQVDVNTPGTGAPRTSGTLTSGSLVLDPMSNASFSSVNDWRANQIENEDQTYFSGGGASTPPTGGGGGSGGGSGC